MMPETVKTTQELLDLLAFTPTDVEIIYGKPVSEVMEIRTSGGRWNRTAGNTWTFLMDMVNHAENT
jgi:hypothetical protein